MTLVNIRASDKSYFWQLINISKSDEVDDLKDGVTQEYEKILRRYQNQAAGNAHVW